MHPTSDAILAALRAPPAVGCAVAAAILGLAAGGVPLLAVPGLELGLAGALLSALLVTPAIGIGQACRELARSAPIPSVLRPFLATAVAALLVLGILAGASALRAAVATPCRPLASVGVFALLAVPSALLSSAVAVAAAFACRGSRRAAVLVHGGAVLLSLCVTLAVAYLGPAASAYDHLLGVWPGPIYDEAIAVDARLVAFRAGTLAWTGGVLAAAAVVARRRAGAGWIGAGIALTAALAGGLLARASGGAPATRAEIAAALGAVREGPRCVVHLAAERGAAEADRALRDCEYDAEAVARALGLARPPRATVWIYRGPDEKRRLVGAGRTSYTKPWLAEIHVNDQGVPHPILRHELVHALASASARGPLRVPARWGVVVNIGLVEGLAVAVDVPSGDHGVHGWARALRDQGRLPPLAALLGGYGFLGAAPARAYAAAGSFVRFALERHGPAAVMAAYRDDDVARGLGRPLAALDAEWQRFLDRVAVPPALAAAAEARFERGSLFSRACAREVASLEHQATIAAARGRPAAAETALRRASALSGGDPGYLRQAADAWRAAGDLDRSASVALEALEGAGTRRSLRGGLLTLLGDLELSAGEPAAALARYRAALAVVGEGAAARTLRARIAISGDARLRAAASPWLLGVGDPGVALSRLAASDVPLARYLLARARLQRGAPQLALSDLAALDRAALPDPSFGAEARRMTALALCRVGRWDEGIAAWRAIAWDARDAGADARQDQADDAASRCAFERDTFGLPVRWAGDGPPPPGVPGR